MTDREKLIALIREGECNALALEDCSYCKYDGEHDCSYQLLADILLANGVVVRENGAWEIHGQVDTMFYCSKCKLNVSGFEKRWLNFCPNCGADMTGGDRNV
jgi:hypothetical protein